MVRLAAARIEALPLLKRSTSQPASTDRTASSVSPDHAGCRGYRTYLGLPVDQLPAASSTLSPQEQDSLRRPSTWLCTVQRERSRTADFADLR